MYNKKKFDGRYVVIQHDEGVLFPRIVDTIKEGMDIVSQYGAKGEDYIICELTTKEEVGVGIPKDFLNKYK